MQEQLLKSLKHEGDTRPWVTMCRRAESVKPNTHRRRRRDETVESRRVGVGGVYMNSRRLPTDSMMRTHNAAVWVTTADGCVHTDDTTKLSPTSCEFVYTPPTRRDSTVSSRRRRRCVLGFKASYEALSTMLTSSIVCPQFIANVNGNLNCEIMKITSSVRDF